MCQSKQASILRQKVTKLQRPCIQTTHIYQDAYRVRNLVRAQPGQRCRPVETKDTRSKDPQWEEVSEERQ
jgi:hypothetical protein